MKLVMLVALELAETIDDDHLIARRGRVAFTFVSPFRCHPNLRPV